MTRRQDGFMGPDRTYPFATPSAVAADPMAIPVRNVYTMGPAYDGVRGAKGLKVRWQLFQGAPGRARPKESFLASSGVTTSIGLPQQSRLPLPSFMTLTMHPHSRHLKTSAFLLMTGLLAG